LGHFRRIPVDGIQPGAGMTEAIGWANRDLQATAYPGYHWETIFSIERDGCSIRDSYESLI
jgi:hypothetical protein